MLVAQIELSDGAVSYLHSDLNGSVTALTDANGEIFDTTSYSPYGTSTGSIASRFGYAGEWSDEITGYSYLRARWLDTSTGTFLSQDPLVQETGNSFGYTNGNPLTQIDPLGLFSMNPLDLVESQILRPIKIQADQAWRSTSDAISNSINSAGQWMYENSGNISSSLAIASVVANAVPAVGQILSLVLGIGSIGFGVVETYKSLQPCLAETQGGNCNWGNVAINTIGTLAGIAGPLVKFAPNIGRYFGGSQVDFDNLGVLVAFTGISIIGINSTIKKLQIDYYRGKNENC